MRVRTSAILQLVGLAVALTLSLEVFAQEGADSSDSISTEVLNGEDLLRQIDRTHFQSETFEYEFRFHGKPWGMMETQVSVSDRSFVVRETTRVEKAGIEQIFTCRLDPKHFTMRSYAASGVMRSNALDVKVTWEGRRISGYSDFPRNPGEPVGRIVIDQELPAHTFERISLFTLLRGFPLREGFEAVLDLYSAHSGLVGPVRLKVTGIEEVVVPAGTFNALRLEITGGDPANVVYVSQESPRQVIKIQIMGQPMEFVLLPGVTD